MESTAWHAIEAAEAVALLDTDPDAGLTSEEAARRLAEYGPNLLGDDTGPSRLRLFLDQFRDVMIGLLIVAALVSGLLLDEWIDAGVIAAIVVLNSVLGFTQEARAENALARLKAMSAPAAVVVRDGGERRVPSRDLVPGDLLVLEVGDRIAADARLIETVHFAAEESALTGESFPTTKDDDPVGVGAALGDRRCVVFSGTSAAAGRARAVVTSTGRVTEVGRIAEVLSGKEPPTPLQVELAKVGRRLAALAVGTAGLVFLTGLVRGNAAEAMFLTSVALAVAAIPEGLPAVVTITLSGGVQRMAARNAIVRRLPAVEALGSASVICTDKTGTITRNEIHAQAVLLDDVVRRPEELTDDPRSEAVATVASLCNDARATPDGYLGDATEVALLRAVAEMGHDPEEIRKGAPRVDEIAFDSRRKAMTTLHHGTRLAAVKGAPEVVISWCSEVATAEGTGPFDEAGKRTVLDHAARLARGGLRTLALALRRSEEPLGDDPEAVERDLTLVAVVGMSDAVRPEAAPAVAEARHAGITVVMVTGDHEVTARAVAAEVGIATDPSQVMPGDRLRTMTSEDLASQVDRYRLYSRIDPLDKVKIVEAWQLRGEIVAMTGDGVNDAPALRQSDIGVAMGSGTDVAKDASDMVLTDDNFATIVAAVREGRGIFTNLKTVVYYLLSCNASEVLVMFVGFLAFGFLGDPLLAVQLLWINLITDGLPALALGVDPPAPDVMERPPDRKRDILSARRQLGLLGFGTVLAAAALVALVLGHYGFGWRWPVVRTFVFTTLVIVQLAHVYPMRGRGTGRPVAGPGVNRLLAGAVFGSLALQVGVVYVGIGQTLFDTAGLPSVGWPVVGALAAGTFAVVAWIGARRSGRPLSRPLRG